MKEKEIVLLKEKYNEILKREEEKKKIFERIHELENDEKVKEYLKLIKTIDASFETSNVNVIKQVTLGFNEEKDLISAAFNKIENITDTNDIWVYNKTGIKEKDALKSRISYDKKYYDRELFIESIYKNIETNEERKVPFGLRKDFENSHNILIDEDYLISTYFYYIQYLYIKNVLERGIDFEFSDLKSEIENDKELKKIRLRKK